MGVTIQTECNICRYCTLLRLILHSIYRADIARSILEADWLLLRYVGLDSNHCMLGNAMYDVKLLSYD